MSWHIYPTASSDDSFNISVELTLVTLDVNTFIISGHEPSGSSAHAIYATHCAAVLGIICSLPKVSSTYAPQIIHITSEIKISIILLHQLQWTNCRVKQESCAIAKMTARCADKSKQPHLHLRSRDSKQTATPPPKIT